MYNKMYSFNRLYCTDIDEIKKNLDIDSLYNIEKYCQEAFIDIKTIRMAIFEQVQRLNEVQTKKYIEVERYKRDYVEIYVRVVTEKTLDTYTRRETDYKTSKQFTGKEKKQALEYAETLKKELRIPIIKNNWK